MARNARSEPQLTATVRMYKGLLGDCFLLRLKRGDATSHILIDCGVLQGVKGAGDRMGKVAADIALVCGGKLDLLVVTHEHWDHISGFAHAPEVFFDPEQLTIGELWFAWTERPDDPQAQRLRMRFDKSKKVVAAIAAAPSAPEDNPFAAAPPSAAHDLANFIGPVDDSMPAADGRKRMSGREIMKRLAETAGRVRYLEPGDTLDTPGEPGVHSYVLGPPRDEALLFRDLPSADPSRRETYLAEPPGTAELLFLANQPDADPSTQSPFSPANRALRPTRVREVFNDAMMPQSEEEARAVAWLMQTYFAAKSPCRYGHAPRPAGHQCEHDLVCDKPQDHRRIDGDWLASAGPLAMKLDSDTNNTSLVLALELPSGEVLLFAGDAQVGNWLSWHEQDYESPAGTRVTAEDILARTILYKVGHHGSHNATLRERGLELMRHPRLAAMIPTVEEVAKQQGNRGWKMPFPELKAELLTRTAGRILRGDAVSGQDADGSTLTRDEGFLGQVREDPSSANLWVEYEVRG